MAGALFTKFIKTLGLDLGDLAIARATPASAPKTDFDAPWIYILEGGSDVLRSLLLWQQTFVVNPTVAFSVVPFDLSTRSWVIANISGDFVSDDPKKMCRGLGVIKETMWNNRDFRWITNQCLATAGVTTTPLECAFRVTQSFDLFYVANCTNGVDAPMWILMGKPITADDSLHRQYLRIIRGATYFIGMYKLEVEKRWLDCVWCKSDTHPGHQCQIPQIDSWLGPRPNCEVHQDMHPSAFKGATKRSSGTHLASNGQNGDRGHGRGRGRGRGNHGGRGSRR